MEDADAALQEEPLSLSRGRWAKMRLAGEVDANNDVQPRPDLSRRVRAKGRISR